jgi:N-methylhydantoinase A
LLVGVDIGGTFTDFCVSRDGELLVHKVLSTPHAPAQAMLDGLRTLRSRAQSSIQRVSHGSTVATNAILERKGAPTALITTQGFRDLLAIGRQDRPRLYALQPQLPPALIPRRWCFQVRERLDHTGAVLVPLDLDDLDAVLDEISRTGIQSVAICLLYSYLNPVHERAIRRRILERGLLPDARIALSCEVLPQFREYERASTVALEAYVRPVVSSYLRRLEEGLASGLDEAQDAVPGDVPALRIMKSDGGVMSAQRAREHAVQTVLSGPAAGVIGGFRLAQQAGYDRIITLDMGGTSTDVSLCPGFPRLRAASEIDDLPLRARLLDVETIGAGGGSLARLDAGGALQVGPQSAGADPGPIVYGRGGEQITVTDANAVLGRLDAGRFLGGDLRLDFAPAEQALSRLGAQMGVSAEEAAQGIVDVANANINRALRRVSVARGHDPREFCLVAFGGAGPLHGCEVASQLDISRLLIPRYPGVLCALGLLMADVVLESSRSVPTDVSPGTGAVLWAAVEEMIARAREELVAEGLAEEEMVFQGLVDARYRGQGYELTIPLLGPSTEDMLRAFHDAHATQYGHAMPERVVEVVNLRLQATGVVDKPRVQPEPLVSGDGGAACFGQRPVFCGDARRGVDLYDRDLLQPGEAFLGPALVFQMDSTVYVAPGWSARVDGYRNLVLECPAREERPTREKRL